MRALLQRGVRGGRHVNLHPDHEHLRRLPYLPPAATHPRNDTTSAGVERQNSRGPANGVLDPSCAKGRRLNRLQEASHPSTNLRSRRNGRLCRAYAFIRGEIGASARRRELSGR
jgi:hypothetical protein